MGREDPPAAAGQHRAPMRPGGDWADRIALADDAARRHWYVLLLVVVAAMVALERIDGALRQRHLPGARAGDMGDLTSPERLVTPEVSTEVSGAWADHQHLLEGYRAVDLLLMFTLFMLLRAARSAVPRAIEGRVRDVQERRYVAAATATLRWSGVAIFLYLAFDLAETWLAVTWALTAELDELTARVVGALSLGKWAMLAAALAPQLLVLAGGWRTWAGATLGADGLRALRGHLLVSALLVALLLALRGDLGRQTDDVVVHATQSLRPAVLATVTALLVCAVMLLGGARCLAAYRSPPPVHPVPRRLLVRTLVAGAALVGVGFSLAAAPEWGARGLEPFLALFLVMLVIPGLALVVWSVLSWPEQVHGFAREVEGEGSEVPSRSWVWVLSVLPLVLLILTVLRAGTSQWAVGQPVGRLVLWGVVLVGLLAPARLLARSAARLTWVWQHHPGRWEVLAWTGGSLALCAVAWTVPATWWMAAGTVATVFWFACLSTGLLTGLTLLGDLLAPRGALAITRLRRLPVITGLLLWGMLASALDREGLYYDARLLDEAGTVAHPREPALALDGWIVASGASDVRSPPPGERTVRSVVLVASAGGGVRAAYWTSIVWQCAFESRCREVEGEVAAGPVAEGEVAEPPGRTDEVFFASGVSGGAVGLALVVAHHREGLADEGWPETVFTRDYVAPAVAGLFLRDLPNSIGRWPARGQDRAAQLERAWQDDVKGLHEPWSRLGGTTPYLSFSGTSVEDGCRFAVSTLRQAGPQTACGGPSTALPDGGPGASPVRDGQDYVCDRQGRRRDIDLATAAFLSARFPYVSPAAGLHRCGGDGGTTSTYVLDGGLFDNSGGAAVSNVLAALEPRIRAHNTSEVATTCLVPRLLVIDSQFASTAASVPGRRPWQTTGPGQAVGAFYETRSNRQLAATTRAVQQLGQEARTDCGLRGEHGEDVVTLYPTEGVGASAPLGWTLAGSTQDTMLRQLPTAQRCRQVGSVATSADAGGTRGTSVLTHPQEMCAAIEQVHAWFGR